MPPTLGVAKFPDLLPLRNESGSPIGLFSDHGSWSGVIWGEEQLLAIHNLATKSEATVDLGSRPATTCSWSDHLEARLRDGREIKIAFADAVTLVIEASGAQPEPRTSLPFLVQKQGTDHWWLVLNLEGEAPPAAPDPQLFAANRSRWDACFQRAFAGCDRLENPVSQVLLARSVTTLLWNLRGPRADLPHAGVIPSPFAYRGYWAWDSWKHARALVHIDPQLAAEQMRLQFCRQGEDGMVADTTMADRNEDNWHNSKPPLAAWALESVTRLGGDEALRQELYPHCERLLSWWSKSRRMPGEQLYRAGGVDHLTATWETGWDECFRFRGIELEAYRSWQLLDLWQPDLNSYILNEHYAMAAMAPLVGADPAPWLAEAEQLASAIRRALWNEARGCFCDVIASSGASTGVRSAASWLPLWAGAASPDQHQIGVETLLSSSHFGTEMPFPVIAVSERAFEPDGYWDGSVWADHSALAFAVLGDQADAARARMRDHLAQWVSLYECYSPLDGRPARGARPAVPQFSWTAAAGIEVLNGGPAPAPRP